MCDWRDPKEGKRRGLDKTGASLFISLICGTWPIERVGAYAGKECEVNR
jgi:hypothetical protein